VKNVEKFSEKIIKLARYLNLTSDTRTIYSFQKCCNPRNNVKNLKMLLL
jgi:hypothetical protein